ncbi:MAG: CDP-diacylglycerol--serine O-phosphatidyltransferase [Verrucomicrobiales bacterium]|nr:CDP-diacylglycerol--serine O-phosphatidyltransferase [Verrucomicrobiales bacterium]
MSAPEPKPDVGTAAARLRIYFLPNVLTGGNLFCGFVALTRIVEADVSRGDFTLIREALFFILLACIFDLLDGRVARWGGVESPFGREFDSLADLISFGAAPAFLVHRIVLKDVFINHAEVGWFIASIYLICGALRLARFNCLAIVTGGRASKEFVGFPIPAAAGLVASLTLFIMWWDERELRFGVWRYSLPAIMLFLSFMMISSVRYPSFKSLNLNARSRFARLVGTLLFLGFLLVLREQILPLVLPVLFTAYLLYGFIRPRLSRRVREGIEEEEEVDETDGPVGNGY